MATATVASTSSSTSEPPASSASSSVDHVLSTKSYLKIVMHALRYPHATVNGVLISEKKGKSSKQNRIVDAIPLFHSGHGLAPMVEVALTQVYTLKLTESWTLINLLTLCFRYRNIMQKIPT